MILFPEIGLMVALAAAGGAEIRVDDFAGAALSDEWRFARCEVSPAPGRAPDGGAALRVACTFTEGTTYCWVRRIYPRPVDAGGARALTFRIHGDPRGVTVTPHLMRLEPGEDGKEREVAFAGPALSAAFDGWRQFQIPLDAFGKLSDEDRRRLRVVNFSLTRRESPLAEVLLADIRLTDRPEGILIGGVEPVAGEAALYALLDPAHAGVGEGVRLAAAGRVEEARTLFLAHVEGRERPRYFVDWRTRAELVRALREHYPGSIEGQIRAADRALARDFTFEGDHRQLGRPVAWLQGPVEWTHILSRFGYWRSLGLAWAATGDEKYARDFVELLRDWVEKNPVPARVRNSVAPNGNTWRTLEAGIRCEEWIRALYWFWDAPSFTPSDKALLLRSLVEHARYLQAHELAIGFQHGNWQVVECAGLAMVALLFPELREADEWRRTAYRLLAEHLERDVYPDGTHHELTPGYHNWVAERLATVWLLARRNGVPGPALAGAPPAEIAGVSPAEYLSRHGVADETPAIPADGILQRPAPSRQDAFLAKLSRMWEFNLAILMPDGAMPAIGDAGRGSLRSQLALGALLFDRPDFRSQGSDLPPDSALWLIGPDAPARYRDLAARPPAFASVRLPDAGYLVQRTGWGPDDLYLMLNAVPYGGGHSHPDSLSLDVFGYGSLLLTDSGRENYNHPLHRDYFRKTRAHNVLQIDGLEQPNDLKTEVVAWKIEKDYEHAAARITCAGFEQRRDVVFLKPHVWVVLDRVAGEGRHRLEQWWHFPAGEAAVDAAALSASSTRPKGANLEIRAAARGGLQARLDEGWIGFRAGGSVKAPVAAFTCSADLPATLAWLLVPRRPGDTAPAAIEPAPVMEKGRPAAAGRAAAVRVRLGERRFVVGIAYEPGDYACEGHRWREGVLVGR